ncbi:DNA uptake protein ComE-like DNA-binding protein [Lutibacter oceani]|uniref:DNA uptake protein ComE-like DNA-binding protein n=1 Tax=Lutibacter oceani TaxID=1853311 RepID=A0A3D9RSN8_9FLAO|nr:helix-hairpin-helix domain-containing protein [Lutibacter oceani]REE82827.1 DNA uptake protein ComE-like DNA-binding protein [Lutibacter oceani]
MNIFKSHFSYNKRQRNGIFFLLLIIVLLQIVFFFVDFSSKDINTIYQNEIALFQKEMDSLKMVELENSKPKKFPFNPNYITDFKGYQLGMSVDEIDRLLKFRAKGNFVNSKEEFQNITKVNDSLLDLISPNFKFPDWVTSKNRKPKNISKNQKKHPVEIKDLNFIKANDLIFIKGVGEKTAKRILNYRDKLQGFSADSQLYEVYYLDKEIADEILKHFKVIKVPTIKKININEATFKEVLSIVYLDYELTKKIFNYRDEVAEIQSIEELKKIDGFPIEKFERITLYLVAE